MLLMWFVEWKRRGREFTFQIKEIESKTCFVEFLYGLEWPLFWGGSVGYGVWVYGLGMMLVSSY